MIEFKKIFGIWLVLASGFASGAAQGRIGIVPSGGAGAPAAPVTAVVLDEEAIRNRARRQARYMAIMHANQERLQVYRRQMYRRQMAELKAAIRAAARLVAEEELKNDSI